jgi:hypothetical protein
MNDSVNSFQSCTEIASDKVVYSNDLNATSAVDSVKGFLVAGDLRGADGATNS